MARIRVLPIIASVVVLTSIGCRSPQFTGGIEDKAVMKAVILKHIPIGTPIGEAKQFMEQEQFECSFENGDSIHRNDAHQWLYCDRQESVDFWVGRRWIVGLIIEDGAVSDVWVNTGLIGL